MKKTNIISFPESPQSEQRFRQIQAEQMMEITQAQIDRILSFELGGWVAQTREQLQQYLEQAMLHGLMRSNYGVHFDTIRAIEYLSRIISDSIGYSGWTFHLLTGEEIDNIAIPESDRFFLNIVNLLYKKDTNFQEYLFATMSDSYNQRAELITTRDFNATEDLRYLFIEIGGILELITASITDTLQAYFVYQHNDTRVILFRKNIR